MDINVYILEICEILRVDANQEQINAIEDILIKYDEDMDNYHPIYKKLVKK